MVHLGRKADLPASVQRELDQTIEQTRTNTGMTLALALNYGGRSEIVDAVQAIARRVRAGELAPEAVDETCVGSYLYTAGLPDPDLVIRTSGELRISNFLIWQGAYAEYYATPTLWPDFDREEFRKALVAYCQRERRFGKLAPPEQPS